MSLTAVEIIVTGTVQGVGFRFFCLTQANNLHINGWVKNLPNGSVHSHAEGTKESIDKFCQLLQQGPSHSVVAQIDINDVSCVGHFDSFEITYHIKQV